VIASLVLSAAVAAAAPPAPPEAQLPMTVYVAKVLAIRKLPDPCAQPEKKCVSTNAGWEFDLEMESAVMGAAEPGVHHVRHFSEFGPPQYAQYEHALVFEVEHRGVRYIDGLGYPVMMTTIGRWAHCPSDREFNAWSPGIGRPVRFVGPVRLSAWGLGEGQFYKGYYDDMPERARECRRAIFAEDLARCFADTIPRNP
jgi:hypothetical protein